MLIVLVIMFGQMAAVLRFLILILAYAAVRIRNPLALAVNCWLILYTTLPVVFHVCSHRQSSMIDLLTYAVQSQRFCSKIPSIF